MKTLNEQIKLMKEYEQFNLISLIEHHTNLKSFNCIIEVGTSNGNYKDNKLYPSTASRMKNGGWNFSCSTNGLISKVYIDEELIKNIF